MSYVSEDIYSRYGIKEYPDQEEIKRKIIYYNYFKAPNKEKIQLEVLCFMSPYMKKNALDFAKKCPLFDYEDFFNEQELAILKKMKYFKKNSKNALQTYLYLWCRDACQRLYYSSKDLAISRSYAKKIFKSGNQEEINSINSRKESLNRVVEDSSNKQIELSDLISSQIDSPLESCLKKCLRDRFFEILFDNGYTEEDYKAFEKIILYGSKQGVKKQKRVAKDMLEFIKSNSEIIEIVKEMNDLGGGIL